MWRFTTAANQVISALPMHLALRGKRCLTENTTKPNASSISLLPTLIRLFLEPAVDKEKTFGHSPILHLIQSGYPIKRKRIILDQFYKTRNLKYTE